MQLLPYALVQDKAGNLTIQSVGRLIGELSAIMPGNVPSYFPVALGSLSDMEAEIGFRKAFIARKLEAMAQIEKAAKGAP